MKCGIVYGVTVDKRMDEDGYRTPLLGRAKRVTRLAVILSIYLCLRYVTPTALHESTTWESLTTRSYHVSSWYGVITEPSSAVS